MYFCKEVVVFFFPQEYGRINCLRVAPLSTEGILARRKEARGTRLWVGGRVRRQEADAGLGHLSYVVSVFWIVKIKGTDVAFLQLPSPVTVLMGMQVH